MKADGPPPRGPLDREHAWALLAALIPVAVLATVVLTGATPFYAEDTHNLGVPYRAAVARSFAAGELPLYSDALVGGHPIHANPHASWLYPPAVLGMLFGPLGGLLLEYAFHLALAGWGSFRLARAHGLPRAAGLIGAVAFGLSGPMVYWYRHYEMVGTIAWLPVLLWAGKGLAERGGRRPAVILAAVGALSFLAGFAQGFVFGLLLLAIYVAWLAAARGRVRRTLLPAAGAAVLFAALVAAAAIPTARLAADSVRGDGLGPAAASWYSSSLPEAVNLLIPDLVPNGFSGTVGFGYVGLLPWVLLPFALGRNVRHWALGGAAAALLVALACGQSTPVWGWAYEGVPALFQRFRNPSRWLVPIGAAVAFIGVAGFPRFLDCLEQDRTRWRILSVGVLGLALGGGGLLAGPLGLPPITGKRLMVAGVLLAGVGGTALLRTRRSRAGALALLAILDMAVFAVPYLNRPSRRLELDADAYRPLLRALERVDGGAARHERSFLGARYYGWHTMPLGLDLPTVSGYCQLPRRPFAELVFGAVRPEWDLTGPVDVDPAHVTARHLPQRLVDLFHVERLVGMSAAGEEARGIQHVEPALPPAGLHTRFDVIEDARRSVARVLADDFDPAVTLVVAADPGIAASAAGPGIATVVPGGGNGARDFDIDAPAPAVLRTTEIHYRDWIATVDGEPARTLRVDHCFLGVVVPAGRHRVSVRYEPRQLGLLLGLYGAGWLLVLAEVTAAGLQCMQRRRGDPRDA